MRISGITCVSRKTHKVRNTLLTVLVLILIAVLGVAIISVYHGWGLLHPDKEAIGTFSSNIVPEYSTVSFRSMDGDVLLSGWLFKAKDSGKTVILVHKYGSNRLEFGVNTIDIIKGFLDKGYDVLAFDLRNSGNSGGKETSMGYYEKDDVLGAIDYIKRMGSKHITLMGFSTGASACILAAAESSVDAVIADSPYADLKDYMDRNLQKWTNLPAVPFDRTVLASMEVLGGIDASNTSPLRSISRMAPASLMLIHGKYDNIIPVDNSQALYSAYSKTNPGKVEFWETDDKGDAASYLSNPTLYMNKVFEFLDKVYTS